MNKIHQLFLIALVALVSLVPARVRSDLAETPEERQARLKWFKGCPFRSLLFEGKSQAASDLAAAMPEKVAEMKTFLEKLITDGRSTPGRIQKNDVEVHRFPTKSSAREEKAE